jgi:hypothetical protein
LAQGSFQCLHWTESGTAWRARIDSYEIQIYDTDTAAVPSDEVLYRLNRWISPAVEYYGDIGPIHSLPSLQNQQHFIVPCFELLFVAKAGIEFRRGSGTD